MQRAVRTIVIGLVLLLSACSQGRSDEIEPERPPAQAETAPADRSTSARSVPPSRDVDAILRTHRDGSAKAGQPVTFPVLEKSFARNGYRFRDIAVGARPFDDFAPAPEEDTGVHDTEGVRMVEIAGRQFDHPISQLNYGFQNLLSYRRTEKPVFLDRAKAQAQRVLDQRVESRGAWFYPYRFDFRLGSDHETLLQAPWYSGLAQGKALSLFSRLYEVTKDPKWREAADRTFVSYSNLPSASKPWFTRVADDGSLMFDEYPIYPIEDSYFTFNGHMSAVFGLWDYYRVTRHEEALALFDGGVTTIDRYADVLRQPNGISRYGLNPDLVLKHYQDIHGKQLLSLWQMTGDTRFAKLSDELRDDYPIEPPGSTGGIVVLDDGEHIGYRFDGRTGAVTGQRKVTLSKRVAVRFTARTRIKGRGIHYLVSEGPLANYYVLEKRGTAMMRGPAAVNRYPEPRKATFVPGRTYEALRYDGLGNTVTVEERFERRQVLDVGMTAWIEGRPHAWITSGKLAYSWVPVAAVTLD